MEAMIEMILLKTTALIIKMVNGISVRMQIFVTMRGVYQVQISRVYLRKDRPALKTTLDMVITPLHIGLLFSNAVYNQQY